MDGGGYATLWEGGCLALVLGALVVSAMAAPLRLGIVVVYSPSDPEAAIVAVNLIKRLKTLRSSANSEKKIISLQRLRWQGGQQWRRDPRPARRFLELRQCL